MPKITVTEPFNYGHGLDAKHYAKGEQEVPQVVADHAEAKGFMAKPKAKAEAKPALAEAKQ